MNYIADTHALLWHFTEHPALSEKAKTLFQQCEKGECVIFIPSIVMAECLSIFDKKKVRFDFKALFERVRKSENYVMIALDDTILQMMMDVTEVTEIHDKIIAATAKFLGVPLITKDEVLQSVTKLATVW